MVGRWGAIVAVGAVVGLGGCTTRQVVENTGDLVVGTTKIAVRGAVGAGRLAGRGTVAGVRRLNEARPGYDAGEAVCVNAAGEIVGRMRDLDGQPTCFLEAGAG